MRHFILVICGASLAACGLASQSGSAGKAGDVAVGTEVFEGPVPRANCGPGSMPESAGALQGQVPLEDRASKRSLQPYSCNLELVGNYAGQGASWQHAWYEDCAYYDQKFAPPLSKNGDPSGGSASKLEHPGVIALDVSDSAHPQYATNLATPAMLDPWESLKVNQQRGLLAAVAGWNLEGPVFFDVYDIKPDCKHPALLASTPMNIPGGHEGNWAFDGQTYYGTSIASWAGIDVSNPTLPVVLFSLPYGGANHGLTTSEDGNRAYVSDVAGPDYSHPGSAGGGFTIWDVTGVQSRTTHTPIPISSVHWTDGGTAQHQIALHYGDKPFVLHVDEGGLGMARIVDISDEKHPRVIAKLKLEVDTDADAKTINTADNAGAGGFAYNGHYCGVDQEHDPTVAGCSYFNSGMRVFDIRDPYHPKEIAYFNPGGLGGASPPGSNRGASASNSGYPSAQVRFIKERGEVWFTDQDKGFIVVRFTNGAWPFN